MISEPYPQRDDLLSSTTGASGVGGGAPAAIAEPLCLSAPLALRLAPRLCREDAISHRDCSWYHGPWQYFRLLDLVTTPEDHAEFFEAELGALARGGRHRRVLICGAADYALLALVHRAYREQNVAPDITVMDICETPLFLNRWYGGRARVAVRTHLADILDYRPERPFDAICTHCFLAGFAPERRAAVAAKWAEILVPGGKLLTINRIRAPLDDEAFGFASNGAGTFRDQVMRAAERHRELLAIEPERLAAMAQTYSEHEQTYPVRSREEVVELLTRGGLVLERFELEQPGDYARIIASRP